MIQFKKLTLGGFKSFVDRTELEIGPGLTGIVGPNGCGKSNLVEALRWVMGESSAKRMRGGEMEDVIFNGTDARPARNFAEVSLFLDNTSRAAPAAWNGEEEIEVLRRIERDRGSAYRVNGKSCRARDVQMLFADTVTGANSPALVSQGRVTAIINAKPQERRMILEESAGVSGLYARRHEAELRLRAADSNLQRLEDLLGGMEGRLAALKKQARQAVKYKNLSAEIRTLEMAVARQEWEALQTRIRQAKEAFAAAESTVAEHMATVAQLTKTEAAQAAELPPLRQDEAKAAAALQAQTLALQRLEDRERELENRLNETAEQLARLVQDRTHETQGLEESAATLERMDREEKDIHARSSGEKEAFEEKLAIKRGLEEKVLRLEAEYESFMQETARVQASRAALEQQISAEERRLHTAQERQQALNEELKNAQERLSGNNNLAEIKTLIAGLEADIAGLGKTLAQGLAESEDAQAALEKARSLREDKTRAASAAETEVRTLEGLLDTDSQSAYRPVLEDIRPGKGFETALSRALGDTLTASADMSAPAVWRESGFKGSPPPLPAGAEPLAPHVEAPGILHMALAMVGVVNDTADGEKLAAFLNPGQSLVSRDGAYWRWDGLYIKADAADRHALHLRQKNRLKELKDTLADLEKACTAADTTYDRAKTRAEDTESAVTRTHQALRDKEQELGARQAEISALTERQAALLADISRLEEGLRNAVEDGATAEKTLAEHRKELAAYDEKALAEQKARVEKIRSTLSEARDGLQNAVRELDRLQQEQSRRKARLHGIADERVHLNNRAIRSRERLKDLEERETALKEKRKELQNRPRTLESDRESLMSKIVEMEKTRNMAADALAAREAEAVETAKALKEAEGRASEAREERAGFQATLSAGQEQMKEITQAIEERFDMEPASMPAPKDESGDIDGLKSQRENLVRERDRIGPVNLRAETEASELESELGGILNERDDLIQAVGELRAGIDTLNTEARERLNTAFDRVNGHFQSLFATLFAGGKAHLSLIESDDPLESGLEIFAQPPGKSLQSLSLLSGGEQTLASIALIFAMFLTNPSPICVLDEIDAPLDDANVDRVCTLLEKIAGRGETRFLVITHHRLTMARMDRLYGVTMAERGISQLVSVDLGQPELELLEAAA